MKFGIALKLGLLLAGVSILASGLTGFYAYQASKNMLVQSAKTELLAATGAVARRITLSREEISRNLQILSSHPAALAILQGGTKAQEDQLAAIFERIMHANPGYFQIHLISANENGLERVRVDREEDRILRISGDDLQEKGHFSYVSGTLGMSAGTTYLSRIVINHERGAHAGWEQPSAILATPVTDPQGRALGVLVINMDLNGLFESLATVLPKDYQLFLANSHGDFLIHPDVSRTFGFDKGRRVLLQDEFTATQDLVDGKEKQVLAEVREGRYAEAPVVAAFIARGTQVTTEEGRLLLGLTRPLADVLEQANMLGVVVLQLVVGLGIACSVLAILLARAVTRPINSMSAAVQQFAYAQQVATLDTNRQDEIGILARSFNHMQDQIKQQLGALQSSRQELEHLARHDVLTGLPNRRLFQEQLDHTLARAQRSGERFALLFIDVDRFKNINDHWGHEGGDAVLRVVSMRLSAATRKVDTVARMGGDEFVVLLDNPAHREDIIAIAEKLLDSVRSSIVHNGQELQVGFSIGISQYPEDGTTAAELMASADHAMYEAKAAGRNGFRFSSGKVQPTLL